MFSVSDHPAAIPTVELVDASAQSKAIIAPSRGGMAIHFFARGREQLFLDPSTFADRAKNVRGGIPILFPSPGKLHGDTFTRSGRSGKMKQHGFARELSWQERSRSTEGAARVELELCDTAATRQMFPWSFRLQVTYALRGDCLRLDVQIENPGEATLPCALGFHPYFAVPDAQKALVQIPTSATRGWDNVHKTEVALSGIDLTAPETDLHLMDHAQSEATLRTPAGTVHVRGSAELSRWVIWQLAGKDFVCLEPWTAPGNALNTGERLFELAPGERRDLYIEIAAGD